MSKEQDLREATDMVMTAVIDKMVRARRQGGCIVMENPEPKLGLFHFQMIDSEQKRLATFEVKVKVIS